MIFYYELVKSRKQSDCWWDLLSLGFMAQCPPTSILYLLESYKIFTVIAWLLI